MCVSHCTNIHVAGRALYGSGCVGRKREDASMRLEHAPHSFREGNLSTVLTNLVVV